jgi:sirohydrochlorin cobaltochelatase
MVRMSLTRRASLFVLAGSSLFGLPGSGFAQTPSSAPERDFGVLVMAHGGSDSWDRAVETMLAPLRADHQMEIAFGMADAASLQESVRKLEAHGVRRIAVVRLFISGESFFERTEQILGLRPGAPPRPAADEHAAHGAPGGHSMALWRLDTNAAFALSTEGLADAPEMAAVLIERARTLSRDPERESVLIIAHGPQNDDEDRRWLTQIGLRADAVRQAAPFKNVHVETLREDWPEKRAASEARIRAYVEQASQDGGRAIVIPYRVEGFGPYAEVLQGLSYVSDGRALLPSAEVEHWVRRQAGELQRGAFRTPERARTTSPERFVR